MWDDNALLLPGECRLGRYHVAILRFTPSGWSPTTPPLKALVTNYRLMLLPQTRRQYQPAIIPSHFIMQISEVEMGYHKGVKIALKNGLRLYMTVSYSEDDNHLTETVTQMMTTPLGNTYISDPAEQDLNRLISFISQL